VARIENRLHEEREQGHLLRVHSPVGGVSPPTSDYSVWKAVWRKWWVILIFIIAGGVLGIAYAAEQPVEYQARSVVVATSSRIPREDISSVLETVFPTDPILEPINADLDLQTDAQAMLASGALVGDSSPGGSLVITALDESPQLSQDLANAAATSFSQVAEDKDLGEFSVLEARDSSPTDTRTSRQLFVIGSGMGGAIGLFVIFGVSFLRQPVLTKSDAAYELPVDAVLSAHVKLPLIRSFRSTSGGARGSASVFPHEISAAAVRLARGDSGRPLRICCIAVTKRPRFGREERTNGSGHRSKSRRYHRAARRNDGGDGHRTLRNRKRTHKAQRTILSQMNAQFFSDTVDDTPRDQTPIVWIGSNDPRLTRAVMSSAGVIVLVPAGCRRRVLQSVAEELVTVNYERGVAIFVATKRTPF
jgi:hypothetical protein